MAIKDVYVDICVLFPQLPDPINSKARQAPGCPGLCVPLLAELNTCWAHGTTFVCPRAVAFAGAWRT